MTIGTVDAAQRQAAKVAGFALPFAMVLVIFANFYIGANLVVPDNAVDTAKNVLAHETRFHIWIACDLLYVVNVVAVSTALYIILKPVSRGLALAAVIFRMLYAIMWLAIALNMLGALTLLSDAPYLHLIETGQLQAMARAHLRGSFDAYYVGLPFWALASTICSILWLKSGYIPRGLASFGLVASAWCLLCAFAFLALPRFGETVNLWLFDTPMTLFEFATGCWLVFKGMRPYAVQT